MQPSSWLDFAWCFSFTRKNCYFISIIHLTVTGKKKSVDYDWIVYPFLFFRTCTVHGWTNQRVGRQPTEEVAAVGSECIHAGGCHSIISSTTISPFLCHSYRHIPRRPVCMKKGGSASCVYFDQLGRGWWSETDSISSEEKREKTVGHYMSPPKLSKANLTHVP
jgi:hypothetical protein